MALQVFTAGQTLTAAQMTTLQASTYNYPLSTISSSTYTILSSDAGKLLLFTNNATPVGVTFPASLGMAVGDTVEIVHAGTGTLSLIADAGVTLNSEGSLLTLTTRYARISVTKTASNVFLVSWMTAITEAEITTGSVTSDKILDGTILNVDINASAAIALSKLATGALPTAITVASANLVDGTIVNADINASAAIAHSKLADATAGQVLLGTTTTGVVTATTISGDVTITGAGVTAIGTGAVTSAKLASAVAGNGLSGGAGTALAVNVDDSTIEINSDTLRLKDAGITSAKLGTDLSLTGTTKIEEIFESATIVAAQPVASNGATLTLTITSGAVYYYTTATSHNIVLDIVTTGLVAGQAATLLLMVTSGATTGKISSITVNGAANTPKWFGGNAYPDGNVAVDAYTITVFRSSTAYTVFASQSKFA